MTKRKNPFDDFYFLRKMHIGIKEVNLGVNRVENMRKVYESTLKMLYSGSEKLQNGNLEMQNGIARVQDDSINGNNNNGHLIHKLKEKKFFLSQDQQEKVSVMNPCCTFNQQTPCSFCERIVCIICCRICHICNSRFCHLCSILKYDSEEETSVCLSCM